MVLFNCFLLLLSLSLLTLTEAAVGVDVSDAVTVDQWNCLQSPGGQGAIESAIVRLVIHIYI